MPIPAPAEGQPVYDTRNGREGCITAIPSPYSPFIRVRWSDGHERTESLEHLAYGRPGEPTDELRRRLPMTDPIDPRWTI